MALDASSPDELVEVMKALSAQQKEKMQAALNSSNGNTSTNAAFVFIKPHANTDKVKALAKAGLESKGITILAEGCLDGPTIDEKQLIDNHYYAIAVKATIKKPNELNVPNDRFKAQFGIDYQAALDSGKVFNALDGCKEFGIDAEGMATAWNAAKDAKKLVKLGGGFYCGLLTCGDKELYIMNGFFMSMRSKFTDPKASLYYYSCQWDPSVLSWEDFRGKVLGPTNPADAPADALRGKIFADWKNLGLESEPNTGDNGMHASASPLEGLAERANWLQMPIKDDVFGKMLLAGGMKEQMIKDWSVDPQVNMEEGKKGSIFDALEDQNCDVCLANLLKFSKLN